MCILALVRVWNRWVLHSGHIVQCNMAAGVVQEEDERHVEVTDAFERCALHALAEFNGLLSASVGAAAGRSVRLRCPRACPPSPATCSTQVPVDFTTEYDASESFGGSAAPQPAMQSPGALLQSHPGGRLEAPQDAAAGSSPILERQEKREVDDRPSSGARATREHGAGVSAACELQLPFTAVDVVAVLQEERQAQAALGRHVDGSLTVAALMAHRQEHLPAEMFNNGSAGAS